MKSYQLTAAALIVFSVLALTYGGFAYTKELHQASFASFSLSVDNNERGNIPVWAGISGILLGGLMFFFGRYPR